MLSPVYIQVPAKIRIGSEIVAVDVFSGAVCERWDAITVALMERDLWGYLKPAESLELSAQAFLPDGSLSDARFSLPAACLLAGLERHNSLSEHVQNEPCRLSLWTDLPKCLASSQRQDCLQAGCCALLAAYELSGRVPEDGLALALRANELLAAEYQAPPFVSVASSSSGQWLLFTPNPTPAPLYPTPQAAPSEAHLAIPLPFSYQALDEDSLLVAAPESEMEKLAHILSTAADKTYAGRLLRATDELCRIILPTGEMEAVCAPESD
jgi:hypothetical protein